MAITCYMPPTEPGMMSTMVCRETATVLPTREEVQTLYESHMTTYMGELKEAYTSYVQAMADLDLINFQLQTLAVRIANEEATIKKGLTPNSDYLSLLQHYKYLETQKTAKNTEIANYQASLDRIAFDIKNYMAQMKSKLETYAIPTATYEQTFALIKSEVPVIPTLTQVPVAVKEVITTVPVPPEEVPLPISNMTSEIAITKVQELFPKKNNMPLIAGALIGLFMLSRKR